MKYEKLLENTTITRDVKCIKILKRKNETLHKVLNRTFEGNKCLRLLRRGVKHLYNKRGLGLNGNITHSTSKLDLKRKSITMYQPPKKEKSIRLTKQDPMLDGSLNTFPRLVPNKD